MALWTQTSERSSYSRMPASNLDCNQLVTTITKMHSDIEKANTRVLKFKNNIWNKILTNRDFENFNEIEYLRWQEIYKDSKNDLNKQNPFTIEQKMALIEVINVKALSTLDGNSINFTEEIEKLNTLKLRKLSKHLASMDLSSKLTRQQIEDFSSDLFIILKGPPISLLDYFTTGKSQMMKKRLHRAVQEDMLIMGLKGLIERIPEKNSYARIENAKFMIQKFFNHKAWKYFVMPYDLPWFERLNIPDELLQKILVDGLDAHNSELIEHLKLQGKIDHYERFRKVYRPIAFSVGFMFYYTKFNKKFDDDMKNNQEEEKQNLLKSIEELAKQIEDKTNTSATNEQILKEEQFNRLRNNYIEKYGEEPTEEELKELKAKVYH